MPDKPCTINQLIQQVVHHCQSRHPEALDLVFDTLRVDINEQVLDGAMAVLSSDIDQLSWLCGYFAGEINCSEDNHKPHHPITDLAKILIESGMQPFIDFTPYPGGSNAILWDESKNGRSLIPYTEQYKYI